MDKRSKEEVLADAELVKDLASADKAIAVCERVLATDGVLGVFTWGRLEYGAEFGVRAGSPVFNALLNALRGDRRLVVTSIRERGIV